MDRRKRFEFNLTDETMAIIKKYEKEFKSKGEFIRQAIILFEQNRNLRLIIKDEIGLLLQEISSEKSGEKGPAKSKEEDGDEIKLSDLMSSEYSENNE